MSTCYYEYTHSFTDFFNLAVVLLIISPSMNIGIRIKKKHIRVLEKDIKYKVCSK
jgi:hypothetical protein